MPDAPLDVSSSDPLENLSPAPEPQRSTRVPKLSAVGAASRGVPYVLRMDCMHEEIHAGEQRTCEEKDVHQTGGVLDTPDYFCVSNCNEYNGFWDLTWLLSGGRSKDSQLFRQQCCKVIYTSKGPCR